MAGAGFEAIREMDLPAHGQRIGEEAVALLDAPQCPSGEMSVILEASQVAIQVHESCGHPTELDRVLGTEASFAGTSFLTTDRLDRFQYGSPIVHIDADATAPGGLGTFGWDDEGVPAQNVPLVSAGRFVGYLTSRETAPVIGRRSMGSSRSASWRNLPLIRMTNVSLRPGEAGTLEDLVADTDEGILFGTNRSWSIDERRLNFQFGSQIGWLIRKGKRAGMVRNPTYTGITPRFWGVVRRDLRTERMAAVGRTVLRQGRTDADRRGWPRGGTGTISRGPGRGGTMVGREVAAAALERLDDGVEGEATVTERDLSLTRFANSHIHQNLAEQDATLRIRIRQEGRTGVATSNRLDPEGIDEAVARAAAIAAHAAPDPDPAPLPQGTGTDSELGWVQATADADPTSRAEGAGRSSPPAWPAA